MGDFCTNQWNLVEISDVGKPQMIKYIVEEEFVTCLVCDMVSMKSETVSRTELFYRAKQKNKNLQLEEDKILDLITKSKASEYKLEESKLNVKYYISGYPYRFTWNLSQSSTEEFMKFFTAPLLCCLKSAQENNEELQELLKKKDEEIAGYKLTGAILVRSKHQMVLRISKIEKVRIPYTTKESYRADCPFDSSKKCPYWRDVTKGKIEDRVVTSIKTIVACCRGYYLVNDRCFPYCEDSCTNGVCSAPGICACSNGYAKSSKNNVCNPVCSSCIHGDCVAPNTCRCHEGYSKNISSQLCEPHCEDGCGFGTCKAPSKCECHQGFGKDENGACTVRTCPVECKGGSCIDGDCNCPIGMDWDAEESSCSCPVPPTTLTPTTLLEDDITTEMEITSDDDYQKDSFWFLVAIIALLSVTLFIILTVIWFKRLYGYRQYNTNSLTYHATFKL